MVINVSLTTLYPDGPPSPWGRSGEVFNLSSRYPLRVSLGTSVPDTRE